MDGLIVVIIFALAIAIFILFAYWTFSKIFASVQARGESQSQLEERILRLEERVQFLEEKNK